MCFYSIDTISCSIELRRAAFRAEVNRKRNIKGRNQKAIKKKRVFMRKFQYRHTVRTSFSSPSFSLMLLRCQLLLLRKY